jgi:ABC-2 type transport system ATP-binding protein
MDGNNFRIIFLLYPLEIFLETHILAPLDKGVQMIEAKNLARLYGEFAAVDDVSFSIESGEVVGLLGHNGAGKTTIMKMLTGFLEPSRGTIEVDGVDVFADPLMAQAQMGYLPENLPLYPELTVAEYLAYAAELRGLDAHACVPAAVAATQLEEKVLDPIQNLSRGYKQRVGVAQAILHKPKFLILDEPSNGLDPNQIQQMRKLIRRLAENATIILSTHIMQEVNAVCDRVLILRAGRLVVDERLDALQRTAGLVLTTAAGADVATVLNTLDVVTSVTPVDEQRWEIILSGEVDAAVAVVARALVAADLPVFGLAPQVRDLEAIFKEVSETGEIGVQHAA